MFGWVVVARKRLAGAAWRAPPALVEGETHAKRGRHSPAPLSEGVDSRLLDEAEAACSMSPPAQ